MSNADMSVNQSSRMKKRHLTSSLSLSLCASSSQVQRASDEASAGSERRQPLGEAASGSQQGGVGAGETSATAAGRDTELDNTACAQRRKKLHVA